MDQAEAPFPLVVAMIAAIGASIFVWWLVYTRRREGLPVVVYEPREPAPWNALHLIAVIGLYVVTQMVVGGLVIVGYKIALLGVSVEEALNEGVNLGPADLAPVLLANAVANLIVVGLAMGLLSLTTKATSRDFGFLPWRPGYDIPLGVAAFLASLLPVYAIQVVLTQFFPSKHPVQQLLTADSSTAMLLLAGFSAVLVAPIAEEFLFRGILQGWLEAAVAGDGRTELEPTPPNANPVQPNDIVAADLSEYDTTNNPYQSPQAADSAARGESPTHTRAPLTTAQRFVPIGISSFCFAIVHWGNGPDPIPLFVLALILGYLYQQTHRLWPCIVLHMCLNATSLAMLLASLPGK